MQQKPSKTPVPGVTLFDVTAIVLAIPLAGAGYEVMAEEPPIPPLDAFVPAVALAVALTGLSAWIHHLHDAHPDRAVLRFIVRPVPATALAAVLLAGLASAFAAVAYPPARSPLLVGLYVAFALALLVVARMGWRAVATSAGRGRGPHDRGDGRLRRLDPDPARGAPGLAPASAERRMARPSAVPGGSETRPTLLDPPADGEGGAALLDVLRSRWDEVLYTAGEPNVLSMTKYLAPPARGDAAPRAGALAGQVADPEAAGARWSRRDDGDATVIAIAGALEAVSAAKVREAFDALVAEQRRTITVDLSAVSRIDSAGVGVVVGLLKRCGAFGGTVRIAGAKDQPLAVLRLLRMDRLFGLE